MRSRPEEILKKVRKLEISTRKIVDTMLSGQYHTRFKGQGMQFAEFREYFPGDDIRHIDWKVTARTQNAHIKKFEEERDLTVYMLVDVSKSGIFGSKNKSKLEALIEACALISFAAVKNNDRVGLILFAQDVVKHIPPKKGLSHAMRLVTELFHQEPIAGGTSIKTALEAVSHVVKHSSVLLIASDFFDTGYDKVLRRVSKKHDVIALRMRDQSEVKVPKIGIIDFQDSESGEIFSIDTSSYLFQSGLHKENSGFEKELESVFLKADVDRLDLWTHEDYFLRIVQYFKSRKRK